MESLLQDLRFALRSMRRAPGFTAIVVLVMALGIGANVNVFSILYSLVYRPWPVPHAERMLDIRMTNPRRGYDNDNVSWQNFVDIRDRAKTLEAVGAMWGMNAIVTIDKDPERFDAGNVTSGVFPAIGVKPMLGRNFTPDEEVYGRNFDQVIISERIWRKRYDASPSVLGRTLRLNGRTRAIVGVMPKDFRFPETEDFWVPAGNNPADPGKRSDGWLRVIARMKPGVTKAQAQAEVATLWSGFVREDPEMKDLGVRVVGYQENWAREVRGIMLVMQVAVMFLLLIACSNVANLLLARAAGRRREIALRVALGASKGRVLRQLLTEAILLSLLGALIGVALGTWGNSLWIAAIPLEMPWFLRFDVDGPVLAFTAALAVLAGVVFGLAPALHASDSNLVESLREGGLQAGQSRSSHRLRNGLIVAEVALSIVLLVGAGLMVRTFLRLVAAGKDVRTEGIVAGRVLLPVALYPNDATKLAFFHESVRRLSASPGVVSATGMNNLPLGRDNWTRNVVTPEKADKKDGVELSYWATLPGAFRTTGVPLLKGRDFTFEDDSGSARVAIVTRTAAKRLYGDADPLGRRLRFPGDADSLGWCTIVGVVGDVEQSADTDRPYLGSVWVPEMQTAYQQIWIMVESKQGEAQAAAALRNVMRELDPDIAVAELKSMKEHLHFALWVRRLFAGAIAVFGVMALVIAAVGLYGVMAYTVAQRTHEIGVRMAIGAQASSVLRMVLGQAMRLTLLGVAIGLAAAFGVTRFMTVAIPGVSPTDPPTYTIVTLVLVASGVLAAWVPAWRATQVNPMTALRCE